MHRIYMAGPLFTTAERRFNLHLAKELRRLLPTFDFVLPQERAATFLPDLSAVVADCLAQVKAADGLLACFDGADADSGTCVEVGYALALAKPVLGYRTDFRGSEIEGVNAMAYYGCSYYFKAPAIETSLEELAATLANKLSDGTMF